MDVYSKNIKEIIEEYKTDINLGLTTKKASEGILNFGENKLKDKKRKTLLLRFIDQFKDVMIIILLIAAFISFGVACYEGVLKEFFEPALILIIVILNAIMGVMQESKAEKALLALQNLSTPTARIIRDGKEQMIEAKLIVPGDIIKLEAGDFIPADARLINSSNLKCEESALTGESVPTEKDEEKPVEDKAPIGDRSNMVFSGCSVTYGTAKAVVTSTGMNTEMGKIARLLNNEVNSQTPLQQKLFKMGKYLGIVALAACAVIFIIGFTNGIPLMQIFMTSVSLAVSAIPEGLPAIVTIVLSIGVQRMVKRNAIVRRLPAVETLGSASVICSDKTGTLTQNKMTLVKAYIEKSGLVEDISKDNSEDVKELLKYATLCCDGYVNIEDGKEEHIGDPTETAIVAAAFKNKIIKDEIEKQHKRLFELPFDSDRKLMSTINEIDGKKIVIVKGAFDVLVNRCKNEDLNKAKQINDEMSKQALRVLAVASKAIDSITDKLTSKTIENDLQFLGLVGMIDPPREEAKEAVSLCRQAGIKPVMITGDHVVTASAIAKQLGIYLDGDEAIVGSELASLSEEELYNRVNSISVYARVSPEDKIRIVKAFQKHGEIVSMTGDGVNDAPALKAADIGCAMGVTGTDVAKGAADMVLTDDNFATIIDAVKEGRGIYDNIKKVVAFLLGTNIGEILTVFFAMILWRQSPLLSMQLLWINLVTDSLPAVALGREKVEKSIMQRRPKLRNEGVFANGLGIKVFLQGSMFAVLSLFAFWHGSFILGTQEAGQTMAFLVLSASQIVQAFNIRSEQSLFKIGPFSNKNLNIASVISVLLIALVLFTPMSIPFGLIYLPAGMYVEGLGLCLVPLVVMEIAKAISVLIKKNNK